MTSKNKDLSLERGLSASVHTGADKLGARVQNLYRPHQPGHQHLLQTGGLSSNNAHGEAEHVSYGQYLFGENYAEKDGNGDGNSPPANWSSYTTSRIGVRLFSRGLMGATFYTLAHRWVPGQLEGYALSGPIAQGKPLQYVARTFDFIYGKPIQFYAKTYYKALGKTAAEAEKIAHDVTTFRTRKKFGEEYGRSLGAEIVGMSTDFAAGSTGDAWGRGIANMLDPNFRNSWERDDGSIDTKEFVKSNAKNAWRIFSRNQGEDWAVALPYVYQMKYQRIALNKLYRGFSVASDHGLNGGSWRMNERGDILGSYAGAGAIDLQARFTGYNIYTLIYRDMYDKAQDIVQHGFTHNHSEAKEGSGTPIVDPIFHSARYLAKSAIKATLYMTPAVPFFWVTRTPQTKAHGIGVQVHSQTGEISPTPIPSPANPFAKEHTRGVFDRALNPMGKLCYNTSKSINKAARALGASAESTRQGFGALTAGSTPKSFAEDWVNASASYTPYMIAKAETALRWDRPKDADGLNDMDRSIYRFIDGIARLNLGEVTAGLTDIREELIRPASNREIQEKRQSSATTDAPEATPDTKVQEITENTPIAVKGKPKGEQEKTKPEENASNSKDTSWQRKHMQEQFMKSPYPEQGATIH